jgi:hypothetical protein
MKYDKLTCAPLAPWKILACVAFAVFLSSCCIPRYPGPVSFNLTIPGEVRVPPEEPKIRLPIKFTNTSTYTICFGCDCGGLSDKRPRPVWSIDRGNAPIDISKSFVYASALDGIRIDRGRSIESKEGLGLQLTPARNSKPGATGTLRLRFALNIKSPPPNFHSPSVTVPIDFVVRRSGESVLIGEPIPYNSQ